MLRIKTEAISRGKSLMAYANNKGKDQTVYPCR